MKTTTLPNTDLTVSAISLGSVPFGTAVPRQAAFAIMDAYAAAGGLLIDTAHVYANWLSSEPHMSEKTIGQWLRQSGMRKRMVIATKGAHPDLKTMHIPRLSPAQIVSDLDECLVALNIDQIDLYFLHRDDPARPVGEIVETLNAQIKAGKIRHFACSNWQPARIAAANAYAAARGLRPFAVSQLFWSLAVANPGAFASDYALMDEQAMAFYAQAGMGVMAFTAQARGFFSKAAVSGVAALDAERRRAFENGETVARLARARLLAQRLGVSISAIVLAYISSHPFVSVPIIGPNSLEQLNDSLSGADLVLTEGMLRYLTTGEEDRG